MTDMHEHDPMKDLADGLRRSAVSTRDALDAIVLAATALADSVSAAELARDERGDLRETVRRLEELVLQLTTDIRALRARLDVNGKGGAQ